MREIKREDKIQNLYLFWVFWAINLMTPCIIFSIILPLSVPKWDYKTQWQFMAVIFKVWPGHPYVSLGHLVGSTKTQLFL
jgi:hypothetical protein